MAKSLRTSNNQHEVTEFHCVLLSHGACLSLFSHCGHTVGSTNKTMSFHDTLETCLLCSCSALWHSTHPEISMDPILKIQVKAYSSLNLSYSPSLGLN